MYFCSELVSGSYANSFVITHLWIHFQVSAVTFMRRASHPILSFLLFADCFVNE